MPPRSLAGLARRNGGVGDLEWAIWLDLGFCVEPIGFWLLVGAPDE